MTIKEITDLAKGNWQWILVVLMSVVEVSKIKINPWTALFNWIGSIMLSGVKKDISGLNSELKSVKQGIDIMKHDNKEDINQLNSELKNVKQELDSMKQASKEDGVKIARIRILRCADEVYRGDRHSKEYFDNVLDDITTYTEYCRSHPNFKNEKTVIAIKRIEEVYERCLEDHGFL